jgi:hypothetical protein
LFKLIFPFCFLGSCRDTLTFDMYPRINFVARQQGNEIEYLGGFRHWELAQAYMHIRSAVTRISTIVEFEQFTSSPQVCYVDLYADRWTDGRTGRRRQIDRQTDIHR